jgi:hypothetical protein
MSATKPRIQAAEELEPLKTTEHYKPRINTEDGAIKAADEHGRTPRRLRAIQAADEHR